MPDRIKAAAAELDTFDKSGGAEHLEKAVENLEEVDLLSLKQTQQRLAARRELLQQWCRVLVTIDRVKDPKFDPDDAPQLNVLPPLDGSNQIPPKAASAAAKKQYEAAVAANEKKKADRRTQFLVRNLEERVVESASRLMQRMYTKSAADRKEEQAVFAETKLPPERQEQILK